MIVVGCVVVFNCVGDFSLRILVRCRLAFLRITNVLRVCYGDDDSGYRFARAITAITSQ